jgi:preprotein translocase subunit SecA
MASIAELSPEEIAKLSSKQLSALTAADWAELSADQIAALTVDQAATLNAATVKKMGDRVSMLEREDLQMLGTGAIAGLSTGQLSP